MNKTPKMVFTDPAKIKSLRAKLGMNQSQFWSRIGVTQSGGSRYESGRNIPTPTQHILTVTYGTEKQAAAAMKALRNWRRKATAEGSNQ